MSPSSIAAAVILDVMGWDEGPDGPVQKRARLMGGGTHPESSRLDIESFLVASTDAADTKVCMTLSESEHYLLRTHYSAGPGQVTHGWLYLPHSSAIAFLFVV